MNEFKHEKMTKYEWEMIEKPLDKNEIDILNLIKKGFTSTDIKVYKYNTIKQIINLKIFTLMHVYYHNLSQSIGVGTKSLLCQLVKDTKRAKTVRLVKKN